MPEFKFDEVLMKCCSKILAILTVRVAAAMVALSVPLFVGMIVHASPAHTQSQVLESPPASAARDNLNKGVQAFRAQNYAAAVDFFKKATELDSDFTNAYLYLATAYAQQFVPGSKDEANQKLAQLAIQTFDKVLEKDPENKTALAGKGNIYQYNAQYDKAREAYLKNAAVDPQNHIPFFAVGAVDWLIVHNSSATLTPDDRSRLIEEGLSYLDKSITLDPNYEDTYWYENLMLREEALLLKQKAEVTRVQSEKQALTDRADQLGKKADEWSNRALDVRRKNSRNTAK